MRNSQGYAVIVDPDGPTREFDTITCIHCQMVVHIASPKDYQEKTGWCFKCGKMICGPCADSGNCIPWERQLEMIEHAAERRRRWQSY